MPFQVWPSIDHFPSLFPPITRYWDSAQEFAVAHKFNVLQKKSRRGRGLALPEKMRAEGVSARADFGRIAMSKLTRDCLEELESLLRDYIIEVGESGLTSSIKRTYIRHASTFVRWVSDDFTPGERASTSSRKRFADSRNPTAPHGNVINRTISRRNSGKPERLCSLLYRYNTT